MRRKYLKLLYALFACLILANCKKENVEGPAGPPGPDGQNGDPAIRGIMHGKVMLYDTLGKALTNLSGTTVTVDGTVPSISLTTDQDGSFNSPPFPSGIYNLTCSKPGYGTMRIIQFRNAGGVNASETGMIELGAKQSSWFDIEKLEADTVTDELGSHYINITINLVHSYRFVPGAYIDVYLSDSPGVGNTNNDYVYHSYPYQLNDSTLIIYNFYIPLYFYSLALYNSQYLYMAVAIDQQKAFTYTDETGNMVFPSAGNLSNEVKVYNSLK